MQSSPKQCHQHYNGQCSTFSITQLPQLLSRGIELGSWGWRWDDESGVVGVLGEGVMKPEELFVKPDDRELGPRELGHRRRRVDGELDQVALRQRVRNVDGENGVAVGQVDGCGGWCG